MVCPATRLPIGRDMMRGPSRAPPTPLQDQSAEPWCLGLTGAKRSIEHAVAPPEASANWPDLQFPRSLCCSYASSCALKPLIVAMIDQPRSDTTSDAVFGLAKVSHAVECLHSPQSRVASERAAERAPTDSISLAPASLPNSIAPGKFAANGDSVA
ncbi:hypothetical protein IQ06DRAFT_91581 [Phaeosphaeriaceae sp. SRC1lsM3a]|nr:hypothetical protein IQ06DRAFT_91581 [Stagonospora sp. SRC1lsM3a]